MKEQFASEIYRIAELIKEGNRQMKCPKLENKCSFLFDKIAKAEMTISDAHGYITLVCEKYPYACELKMKESE